MIISISSLVINIGRPPLLLCAVQAARHGRARAVAYTSVEAATQVGYKPLEAATSFFWAKST